MIFPNIKHDPCVQLCDCIRIDASNTIISKPETDESVRFVEIAPDGVNYVFVKNIDTDLDNVVYQKDWYLDWCFDTIPVSATDGVVNPSIRITATDGGVFTKSTELSIKTAEEDCLFTDDNDLVQEEHDVLKWLPAGRTSFLYLHRRAKDRIFSWLDEQNYKDCYGNSFTKEDVLVREEFKEWSRFLTLRLLFNNLYNSAGDVYKDKYEEYCKKEAGSRNRMYTLDVNGNGKKDDKYEQVNVGSGILRRT